jgi:hypothetical protein
MKSDTVFGHLAHQFAIHPEDLATEALAFILRTSPAASRAFSAFISQVGFNFPESLHFETQRAELDQSRPDMTCFDDERQLRVIVENKFWAGLTDNQPNTYIGKLPNGVAALVLFVVPEARRKSVWGEVEGRCKARVGANEVKDSRDLTFVEIGDFHYLALTSWSAMLSSLSAGTPSAGEVDCRSDIAQLQGLCGTMDEEEILPFREDELTNLEMARRLINLSDLALGIVNGAVSASLFSREGVRETNYRHGSGSRIQIGKYTLWLGFDAKSWLRLGVSPIWVYFYPPPTNPIAEIREKLAKFRTGMPPRLFDSGKGLLVPILLAAGFEKYRLIQSAIDQTRKLMDELGVQEPFATAPDSTLTGDPDARPECHAECEADR